MVIVFVLAVLLMQGSLVAVPTRSSQKKPVQKVLRAKKETEGDKVVAPKASVVTSHQNNPLSLSIPAALTAHDGEDEDVKKTDKKKKQDPKKKKTPAEAEKDIFQWLQTYSEVVSLLEKKSFKTVDFSKFIQESLKSAVGQVDAHSSFFGQQSYKAAIESTVGEFPGIGVSVISKAPDDDALVIIDVIESGPAAKAGLKGGDKIVEVDGVKLKGLNADEVIAKLKGKVGTKVVVKVLRKKKPLEFAVTRDIIKDQTSQSYKFVDQNVYYVSLKIFNELSAKQVREMIKKANEGQCNGLILDLRKNPGGTLDSAIEMADLFLPKDSVVVLTKDNQGKVVQEYKTKHEAVLKSDVPIFIVIDNFTASAAEILAGCLCHHAKQEKETNKLMVFLVGIPTFGKGSVQELIPIKNGCALKLTTMLYYLPDGNSIQALGIKPDFAIKPKYVPVDELKWVQEFFGKETALANHISIDEVHADEADKSKKKAKGKSFWNRLFGWDEKGTQKESTTNDEEKDAKDGKNWEERQQEGLALDVQIQTCVNMISLLSVAKQANPALISTRKKAKEFLKKHYLTDIPVSVEKIK